MKTISELMSAMDAIVNLSKAENRSLDESEVQTYEALESELKAANKTAELTKRQEAYAAPVLGGFPAVIKATPKGDAGLDYAFSMYLKTGVPNSDISTFAQTEGSTTAGGYTVPDSFLTKLIEARTAFGGFANLAENITTADGRPLAWPSLDAVTSSEADIAAEGAGSAAGADLTFGEVTIGAYKYAATGTGDVPLKVSVELLQDSMFDVAGLVARKLGERIARKQAYDLVRGTGSSEPLGIMNGTGGAVATASGSVPTYAKFVELVHALDPVYRSGASFIMNDATLMVLEKLEDDNKRPLLMGAMEGISQATPARLLGFPIYIDQAIPNLANNVQGVGFGRWKEAYIVRHVKDVQVLANPYASVGYVEYSAWARMDGNVQNAAAFKTMEGTT